MTAPTYNLNPSTRTVRAAEVKPGHIVLTEPEHPATVVRVTCPSGAVRLWCRYIWQASNEPAWRLRDLHPDAPVYIAR